MYIDIIVMHKAYSGQAWIDSLVVVTVLAYPVVLGTGSEEGG